jgi:formamidopyrimidine-DNA glycosylase
MLELPEAVVIAQQINNTLKGKRIASAMANQSPHKFAWYTGDPKDYNNRLAGKTIGTAAAYGGNVGIKADDMTLLISAAMRYHAEGEKLPKKHQLLITFEDSTAFSVSVQMWGGIFCFKEGEKRQERLYYQDYPLAKKKPSPLSEQFDRAYYNSLFDDSTGKLSAKAFLATEQRIPGLGNGVLQDVLWTAKIHPKRKMSELSDKEITGLYNALKSVLRRMVMQGGRDTEDDLFGRPGGYKTVLSKNTVGKGCPNCGTKTKKEAYMGGSIYYCKKCQRL